MYTKPYTADIELDIFQYVESKFVDLPQATMKQWIDVILEIRPPTPPTPLEDPEPIKKLKGWVELIEDEEEFPNLPYKPGDNVRDKAIAAFKKRAGEICEEEGIDTDKFSWLPEDAAARGWDENKQINV